MHKMSNCYRWMPGVCLPVRQHLLRMEIPKLLDGISPNFIGMILEWCFHSKYSHYKKKRKLLSKFLGVKIIHFSK